ncbi:hypothetical protein F5887DRAFT_921746 [Amanita rubescens]|nr:hypothetical protein F5887DRAFT_921746 [Amanita rubescens]
MTRDVASLEERYRENSLLGSKHEAIAGSRSTSNPNARNDTCTKNYFRAIAIASPHSLYGLIIGDVRRRRRSYGTLYDQVEYPKSNELLASRSPCYGQQGHAHQVPLQTEAGKRTRDGVSLRLEAVIPRAMAKLGYEEGDKRVIDKMVSGYPRFFIPLVVQKLTSICEQKRTPVLYRTTLGKKCLARVLAAYMVRSVKSVLKEVSFNQDRDFRWQWWWWCGIGGGSHQRKSGSGLFQKGGGGDERVRYTRRRVSISGGANGTGRRDNPEAGELGADCQTYLEERYGRNLPLGGAASAKRALRRRLAGVLIKDSLGGDCVDGEVVGSSSRVAEGDVHLFPSGMAAIWTAHQCLMGVRGFEAKSVCFGWVYDRVPWGDFGAVRRVSVQPFVEIGELEGIDGRVRFCARGGRGSIVNVEVIQYTDIVVSSLTGIFSGDANVMGGSLVLNPQRRYYKALKDHLGSTFEDIYFDEGGDEAFTSRAASEALVSEQTLPLRACIPSGALWRVAGLAAGFGIEAGLVRVSVGMEAKDDLLKLFKVALNAAQI